MRALFYALWLAYLVALAASVGVLPDQVGDPGKTLSRDAYLLIMGLVGMGVALLLGPGLLALLRRMQHGGVNLPHADYWFTGERRAASLRRLEPHMHALGAWTLGLLLTLHGLELWAALPGGARAGASTVLVVVAAFVLGLGLSTLRLLRAFPAPPVEAAPAPRGRGSERSRGQP